jgi:HK97 family phage major capsid protein
MRHDTRDNQAAVVAAGARKPTSNYELTPVEDRCRVIAHLSNPISRMSLADAPTLSEFVPVEMFYGVERALEAEIIGGNGTGEHLTGLANTSGVQVVPYHEHQALCL